MREELKKQILKDNYLDIAYKRYLRFKDSASYDVKSTFDVLHSLKEYFNQIGVIDRVNVEAVAIKLKECNPSDIFAHWSNFDDLLSFINDDAKEVARLWNELYDDATNLEERINSFREAGKVFKRDINFHAPFFGYLLAAFDYEKYPLYKGTVFEEMKRAFTINKKSGPASDIYVTYFTMCGIIMEYLQSGDSTINMLDVQDFLYSVTSRDEVKVESAIEYLYVMSNNLHTFKKDPAQFLDAIKQMDQDALLERRAFYENREKINKIRHLFLDKLIRQGASIQDLEGIKNEVSEQYETNILNSWNNFTILFQIYYANRRNKVKRELACIHEAVRNIPELQGFDFVKDKTLNGFDWNNQFGTEHAWLAVYETKYDSHRSAIQLYIGIFADTVSYGTYYGSDHASAGKEDKEVINDIDTFSFDRFCTKIVDLALKLQPENGIDTDDELDNAQSAEMVKETENTNTPYGKADFLGELFIDEAMFDTMANLLDYKKNIILQGPPGVGKTFLSKRLAYALVGEKDHLRVEIVQFHQNYAYEDFVMGYRPNEHGKFQLAYGVFYDFCQRAIMNPELSYYFIIDEINRGNLSKIFGELFMLIEKDKRDEHVTMGYSKEKFTVPENVFLIGTMNTADRSLAQIDVALRRRFSFITLDPQFNSKWSNHLLAQGISNEMQDQILKFVGRINHEITRDFQLGRGYEIGHSFFTAKPDNMDEMLWFKNVITFEIRPLLEEYYFDRPEKITELIEGV